MSARARISRTSDAPRTPPPASERASGISQTTRSLRNALHMACVVVRTIHRENAHAPQLRPQTRDKTHITLSPCPWVSATAVGSAERTNHLAVLVEVAWAHAVALLTAGHAPLVAGEAVPNLYTPDVSTTHTHTHKHTHARCEMRDVHLRRLLQAACKVQKATAELRARWRRRPCGTRHGTPPARRRAPPAGRCGVSRPASERAERHFSDELVP
jgi:hypothetical protein